jgi:hypothetical protein
MAAFRILVADDHPVFRFGCPRSLDLTKVGRSVEAAEDGTR